MILPHCGLIRVPDDVVPPQKQIWRQVWYTTSVPMPPKDKEPLANDTEARKKILAVSHAVHGQQLFLSMGVATLFDQRGCTCTCTEQAISVHKFACLQSRICRLVKLHLHLSVLYVRSVLLLGVVCMKTM
jgi:hypothetical protein